MRDDVAAGAAAGLCGALAMMVARPLIERAVLRRGEEVEAEWEHMVRVELDRMGARPPRAVVRALSVLAHLGYGAALGGGFAAIVRRRQPAVAAAGIPYGLLVYEANYAHWGLMPQIHALPPHDRRPARHAAIPVIHHLLFGLVTAGMYRWLAGGLPRPTHLTAPSPRAEPSCAEPQLAEAEAQDSSSLF